LKKAQPLQSKGAFKLSKSKCFFILKFGHNMIFKLGNKPNFTKKNLQDFTVRNKIVFLERVCSFRLVDKNTFSQKSEN
jgi:hypothetical protein